MPAIFKAKFTPTITNFGNVSILRSVFIQDEPVNQWPVDKQSMATGYWLKAPVSGVYTVSVIVPPTSVIQVGGNIIVKRNGVEISRIKGTGATPTDALDVTFYAHANDEITVWGYNTSGGPVQWDNLEVLVALVA